MNRRSFLSAMIKAAAGAMILPSAVTYARTWKPTASGILFREPRLITGFWIQTSQGARCIIDEEYHKILSKSYVSIRAQHAEDWCHFKEMPLAKGPSMKDKLMAISDEAVFQSMVDSGKGWA